MKLAHKILSLLLFTVFTTLSTSSTIEASDVVTNQQNIFSFYPAPSPHLNEKTASWFDVNSNNLKGKTITLGIVAENNSDKEKTIFLKPTNGLTAINGGIDQNEITKTKHTGFLNQEYAIKDNIKNLPDKVNIEPNSKKIIEFEVDVPKGKGQYIGGITYTDAKFIDDRQSENNNENSTFDIKQIVSFSTAIVLNNSSEDRIDVDYSKAIYETSKGRPTLRVKIENNNKMLKDTEFKYSINHLDDNKTIFSGSTNNILMSPKTYINYNLGWDGIVASGKYELIINDDIVLPFEINYPELSELTPTDEFEVEQKDMFIWYLLLILLLLLLILYLLFRRQKDKKEKKAMEEKLKSFDEYNMSKNKNEIESTKNNNI